MDDSCLLIDLNNWFQDFYMSYGDLLNSKEWHEKR